MAKRLIWTLLALVALPILLEVAGRCLWYQSPNGSTLALSVVLRDFNARRSLPAVQPTRPATEPDELAHFLGTSDEIQRLATAFQAQHITLHNTPCAELRQPAGSAHFIDPEFTKLPQGRSYSQYLDADGHLCNIPKAAYDMYYLRSRIFNRHDPVVFEARAGDVQTGSVLAFRARYALEPKRATIDENGDRITLPASTASDLILVVGDSMAFGYGVGDEETLPSHLQRKHPGWRFVNVGVSGCRPRDNFHRLRQRLALFGTKVKGVVYVHCENDYDRERGDDPASILSTLLQILDQHAIPYRALVYQSYIYRTLPDLFRSNSESDLRRYYGLKHEMLRLAAARHLPAVDFHQVVDDYRKRQGTPFAGLSLYVDHCHFSALGNRLVADALPPPPSLPVR